MSSYFILDAPLKISLNFKNALGYIPTSVQDFGLDGYVTQSLSQNIDD